MNDQRLLGIINCTENYSDLRKACFPIFEEINHISDEGHIIINGNKIETEIIFVGDMKFLQIILGLSNSLANYSCPWCKVHKNDREELNKTWDFYHEPPMARTISDLSTDYLSNRYGSKFKPLITIEPCKIIPDELHLFLRISDILLRNLIEDARNLDQKNEIQGGNSKNLEDLVLKIRECGVTFSVWAPKDKGGEIEWTSLTGSEYKLLFENLPRKFFFLIHSDTHDDTVKLWTEFYYIYKFICNEVHEFSNTERLFERCKSWANLFLSLGASRTGYCNVTPYIHTLVYHIPWFAGKYGKLSKYSGQGTEKINDALKQIHQKRTNKQDATVDALKARKRIEYLHVENCKREKRKYHKHEDLYWESIIKIQRSSKKSRIVQEIAEADLKFRDHNEIEPVDEQTYANLSTKELKSLLFEKFGIKSNLRKKEKLIELLEEKHQQNQKN